MKATNGENIYANYEADVQAKVKTPAQPEAVRVKTSMAGYPDYLDSSVPT